MATNSLLSYLTPEAAVELKVERLRRAALSTGGARPLWQPNPDHADGRPNPQRLAYESEADVLGYGGAAGGGKALSVETPVLTTDGWKTMGDLRPGDRVFGRDGYPTFVLAVSEIMSGRPCYRLTTDDGATLVADAAHEWLTFTQAELAALTRRTDEWRAARRATRPSRVTGNKSEQFTKAIVARNRAVPPSTKPPPTGWLRTTAEIANTVQVRRRTNHAIPLADGLSWPTAELPLAPYLLGVWLGDGTSADGVITTADEEIVEAFRERGFEARRRSSAYGWGILGLKKRLRALGVLGCKHIPDIYLRADRAARLALLQGLMDTDGTVATRSGSAEFANTNKELTEGVLHLILSLGHKASIREGRAKFNGRDCGPKFTIKWMAPECVFRLERKRERQKVAERPTTRYRYVVSCEEVESVPVRCIQVAAADGLFLAGKALVVTHNSSLLLGLAATAHRRSVIFRRVFPNLRGIIEESKALFGPGGYNEMLHRWALADGRMVEFEACQFEKDREKQRGRPRDFYGFDEATEFTRSQFEFITAWNRTTVAEQRCRVVMTFNPPTDEGGSWVIDYFLPWLAFLFPARFAHPRPAAPGELRWYATIDGRETERPDGQPFEHDGERIQPRSRTFIPARLDDNPHLADGNYRSTLQALPEPLRSQLLDGDFTAQGAADPWQVIPTAWVKAAQSRWLEMEKPDTPLSGVGVDVARGGRDSMVVARRYGTWFDEPAKTPGVDVADGPTAAGLVFQLLEHEPHVGYINVDVIGVGSSAYDSLAAMYPEAARAVNVAEGSDYVSMSKEERPKPLFKMRNTRAEMYWRFREALDPDGGQALALPPGNELVADLCAARYRVLAGGIIQIEEKAHMKERLGRSPDVGEAVMLAWHRVVARGSGIHV